MPTWLLATPQHGVRPRYIGCSRSLIIADTRMGTFNACLDRFRGPNAISETCYRGLIRIVSVVPADVRAIRLLMRDEEQITTQVIDSPLLARQGTAAYLPSGERLQATRGAEYLWRQRTIDVAPWATRRGVHETVARARRVYAPMPIRTRSGLSTSESLHPQSLSVDIQR